MQGRVTRSVDDSVRTTANLMILGSILLLVLFLLSSCALFEPDRGARAAALSKAEMQKLAAFDSLESGCLAIVAKSDAKPEVKDAYAAEVAKIHEAFYTVHQASLDLLTQMGAIDSKAMLDQMVELVKGWRKK